MLPPPPKNYKISSAFSYNFISALTPMGMQTDRKLLQKIREKKIAMGHKPDDHPDVGMTMGW